MNSRDHLLRVLMVLAMAVLSTLAGCGSSGGLLQRAGIAGPSDVRMVVFQGAGYGHLPMNPTFPLRGRPVATSNATQIKAFYDAVNNPDGKAWMRAARNSRLAFVTRDGRVVMFGFNSGVSPTKGGGPDITAEDSSGQLMAAMLDLARSKNYRATTVPIGRVASIRTSGKQLTGTSPKFKKAEALWRDLLDCYSPASLKGNVRCSMREVKEQLGQAPQYLEVNLARPAEFKAVVTPAKTDWPPDYYDTSGAFEGITYDCVYALAVPLAGGYSGNLSRLVRFAFVDSKTGNCLLTDSVDPRKLTKKAHGRQPAVYGPDLYGEVISLVQ